MGCPSHKCLIHNFCRADQAKEFSRGIREDVVGEAQGEDKKANEGEKAHDSKTLCRCKAEELVEEVDAEGGNEHADKAQKV